MTEDEMAGWHHQLNGHEFKQAPGVGDGQGSLACWKRWGYKELDVTEWLNWTELNCDSQVVILQRSFLLPVSTYGALSIGNITGDGVSCCLMLLTTLLQQEFLIGARAVGSQSSSFADIFFLLQNQIHLLRNDVPAGPILLRRQSHRLMGVCPVTLSHLYESSGALSSEISNPQQNFFTEALILLLRLFYWLTQASHCNLG